MLGPSGSGKTTLLNIIGALDSPSEGRVVVAGRDITRASRKELFTFRRQGVSFVFQTSNLFPALTALENVEFGADVAGRARTRALAGEMLDRVGLTERGAHFPHELSGGEQQRVSIARTLANGNPILWPTSRPASSTSTQASRSSSCCTPRPTPVARSSSSRTTARSGVLLLIAGALLLERRDVLH